MRHWLIICFNHQEQILSVLSTFTAFKDCIFDSQSILMCNSLIWLPHALCLQSCRAASVESLIAIKSLKVVISRLVNQYIFKTFSREKAVSTMLSCIRCSIQFVPHLPVVVLKAGLTCSKSIFIYFNIYMIFLKCSCHKKILHKFFNPFVCLKMCVENAT